MTSRTETIGPDHTVGQLASTLPGASRVFHRHGIDFCCGGSVTLAVACSKAGLDVETVIAEVQSEAPLSSGFERWDKREISDVIEHVLSRFHESHRQEFPRLIAMAKKVEAVHGDKGTCPCGLSAHLEQMAEELELHMQKEEQVLFPMLQGGRGQMAAMPISVLEEEHQEHGKNLERLRELTNNYTPPPEACGTWNALFLGLAELQAELMEHIHTENNILFPRAMQR